jgi:two-component system, sensor histidine kinase and response regulator
MDTLAPENIGMTPLILFSVALIILLTSVVIRSVANKKRIESYKKRIEELDQIQKSDKDRINELELEIQQLAGVVSHDLRTPFNRMFALMQLMQNSSDNLQHDQKDYLSKTHIVIADGLGMIRNLTDYQKLEGKGIELNSETFNFSSSLGLMARNYKVTSEIKNIQVHLEMQPAMMVYADKYYLYRILDNLVSNAVKFSAEGKNVFIKAHDAGTCIEVSVQDEGPGISEEDKKRLYKKFQTLTAKPTGGEMSTGIGLAVAKTLADKMKAKLSCVSKPGEGSTFTLYIAKEKSIS